MINCLIALPRSRKNCNFADDMQREKKNTGLETIVAETIRRHDLLVHGDKVIVALSGGADSVALLAVLQQLGYECVAAHCNFHLRGEESMRDMRHVEKICQTLGIDLMVRDFDVEARRKKTHESIEMACRSLRYEWFDSLLTRERARAVAVGHHAEDNVETFLLNLMRSTGIDGLTGMRYRRDYVIRPMLDSTRIQIEDYLKHHGLDFVVDSSNMSDAYLRNRLRNNVIPCLLDNFPHAEQAIQTTASNLAAAASIYHRAIDDYRRRFIADDGAIDLKSLVDAVGPDATTVLWEFLKELGISTESCLSMVASVEKSGLKFYGENSIVVELDRGVLNVNRPDAVRRQEIYPVDLTRDILVPVNLRISRHHVSEFRPERDVDVIYLDASALGSTQSWSLRRWRRGDRISPFGMTGSRLVSDLFSDAKFSAADKRNAWLLTCGEEIVWAVGLRASSLFPVTPQSREYLKIIYKH